MAKMKPSASDKLLPEVTSVNINKIVTEEVNDEEITECNQKEIYYGAGDAIFSSFIVAPQVVSVWRGTWGIMELHPHLFPYAQIFMMGIIIHVSFALVRSVLLSRSQNAWGEGRAGRWLRERFVSKVYTYIFILSNIMHWRGGWGLLDMFVAHVVPEKDNCHRPVLIGALTLLFYLATICIRSSRNILASPYFLVTDGKEATYIFTTRFQKPVSYPLARLPSKNNY